MAGFPGLRHRKFGLSAIRLFARVRMKVRLASVTGFPRTLRPQLAEFTAVGWTA
jgi:hypothetical protein